MKKENKIIIYQTKKFALNKKFTPFRNFKTNKGTDIGEYTEIEKASCKLLFGIISPESKLTITQHIYFNGQRPIKVVYETKWKESWNISSISIGYIFQKTIINLK